jgi:uncharacterized protein with HEPN domain
MRERSRDKGRLEDMLKSITNVQQYVEGVSYDEFVKDTMRYFAIMKNVEIIGEAANLLTRNFRMTHTQLPWRQIVGMRNVLVHGYANISDQKLWQTATEDLAPMAVIINRYLSEIDWSEWKKGEDEFSEMMDNDEYKMALDTARKLKKTQLSLEQIAEVTGLKPSEIENL